MSFEIQGSAIIRRLRTGQTISLSLDSDKVLLQIVSDGSPTPSPDWTQEENQPVITPNAIAQSGATVSLSDHVWKYKDSILTFDTSSEAQVQLDGETWSKCTSGVGAGLFAIGTGGKLRIIGNIASADNYIDDTLEYSGDYVVGNSQITGTISAKKTINLLKGGASSWIGMINTNKAFLDGESDEATITSYLSCGTITYGSTDNAYTCKWYIGSRSTPIEGETGTTVKIKGSQVSSHALIICDFVVGGSVVATDGCYLTDKGDQYDVMTTVSGDLDDGQDVTATATIINMSDKTTATGVSQATWYYYIYRADNVGDKDVSQMLGGENDSDFTAIDSGSSTITASDGGTPYTYSVAVSTTVTEKNGTLPQSDLMVYFIAEFDVQVS